MTVRRAPLRQFTLDQLGKKAIKRSRMRSSRPSDTLFRVNLPGRERAVVDIGKLLDYCLSATHVRGRHKARVFLAALGLTSSDAEFLQNRLLQAALEGDAVAGAVDQHGSRYTIDFKMMRGRRHATIRSAWIVRHGDSVPRLTSCFVVLD
jgi:hypothetical protein